MAHRVSFPKRLNKNQELNSDLESFDITSAQAKRKLLLSTTIAVRMSGYGVDEINTVVVLDKNKWVSNFNEDARLLKWFGKVDKKGDVKDVYNRMKSIHNRLLKGLHLHLRPHSESANNAENYGTFFSPRRYKVFPRLVNIKKKLIASVLIHELVHLWFHDQYIGAQKVNNGFLAIELARLYPKKARKSAENYEGFCREFCSD